MIVHTPALAASTPEAIARIPHAFAVRHDVAPIAIVDGVLTIATANPDDGALLDLVHSTARMRIAALPASRDAVRERIRQCYTAGASATAVSPEAPVVRLAHELFQRSIAAHASDLHIEPDGAGGSVRIRVDGMLLPIERIEPGLYGPLTSRIKLIANMDVADRRQPQDGRATIPYAQRAVDARVSSIPTVDGEKLVIRLLDQHAAVPSLERLGVPPGDLTRYRALAHAAWGFIVVVGPTGSGKTTTLYASLAELDARSRNICSVEDPVEARLPGVIQVQVQPKAGIGFAEILRAFMRQDPNVIMVGEMRDRETAAVGINAALAGALVFTTLHANDAPRAIERLVELGVSRHALSAGLSGILAQRLVRKLCARCRVAETPTAEARARLGFEAPVWYRAAGCVACNGSGYLGRVGVFECIAIDDDLRECIAAGGSSVAIHAIAASSGYRPMMHDGLEKVAAGETSVDELLRNVNARSA